jgi:nitrogen regulatory protein P-II 1
MIMTLKKIEAVFPKEKLDAVFNALTQIDISGFTYFDV